MGAFRKIGEERGTVTFSTEGFFRCTLAVDPEKGVARWRLAAGPFTLKRWEARLAGLRKIAAARRQAPGCSEILKLVLETEAGGRLPVTMHGDRMTARELSRLLGCPLEEQDVYFSA